MRGRSSSVAAVLAACTAETADPAKPEILVTAGTLQFGSATVTVLDLVNTKTKDVGQCALHPMGSTCSLIDCRQGVTPAFDGALAGGITAGDGVSDSLEIAPDPSSGWYPARTRIGPALWAPGTRVTIAAAGDKDIPSFNAPLTMPAPPTLTSPLLAADGSTPIDRTQPLSVAWTSGSSGTDAFYLTILQQTINDTHSPPSFVQVYCVVDGATGSTTVPAEAMSQLVADTGQTSTALGVGNAASDHSVHGRYPIVVSLVNVTGGVVTVH